MIYPPLVADPDAREAWHQELKNVAELEPMRVGDSPEEGFNRIDQSLLQRNLTTEETEILNCWVQIKYFVIPKTCGKQRDWWNNNTSQQKVKRSKE